MHSAFAPSLHLFLCNSRYLIGGRMIVFAEGIGGGFEIELDWTTTLHDPLIAIKR